MQSQQHIEPKAENAAGFVVSDESVNGSELSSGSGAGLSRSGSTIQRARADARSLRPAEVLRLQNTIGNQAVTRMLQGQKSGKSAKNVAQRLAKGVIQRAGEVDSNSISPSDSRKKFQDMDAGSKTPAPNPTSPITGNPKIQIEPGKPFDVLKAAETSQHWKEVESRLKARDLGTQEILETAAEYVLAMQAQKNSRAKYILSVLNGHFQQKRGFATKQGDDITKSYKDKSSLWSGAKEQAQEYATHTGGIALEVSKVGSIFDGLSFGLKWNDALSHQWNEFSRLYAQGITGEVHIHQYRGVRTGSVFNKVEYPVIKDGIDGGWIEPVIHLYSNWGKLQSFAWGSPMYGSSLANAGEKSRKEETTIKGKSGLDKFMGSQWEFGDAQEKKGGYWKTGAEGALIKTPDDKGNQVEVYEGSEW